MSAQMVLLEGSKGYLGVQVGKAHSLLSQGRIGDIVLYLRSFQVKIRLILLRYLSLKFLDVWNEEHLCKVSRDEGTTIRSLYITTPSVMCRLSRYRQYGAVEGLIWYVSGKPAYIASWRIEKLGSVHVSSARRSQVMDVKLQESLRIAAARIDSFSR